MNEISFHEFYLVQDVYLHTRVAQDEFMMRLMLLIMWAHDIT